MDDINNKLCSRATYSAVKSKAGVFSEASDRIWRTSACNRCDFCCMREQQCRSKLSVVCRRTRSRGILCGFLGLLILAPSILAQRLTGLRVERGPDEQRLDSRMFRGEIHLIERTPYTLRLFGHSLNEDAVVRFTEQIGGEADDCDHGPQTKEYILERQNDATGLLDVLLPKPHSIESTWYLCLRSNVNATGPHFIHQGNASWLSLVVESEPSMYMLPLPLQIMTIVALLCLSGLFSGLNLGVMSLDLTELKLIENSGTRRERSFAKKIRPVREHGNFLLCTILFGNVLVNSCLTILLDDLTGSGIAAVASATMAIVIFGEIIPQSICSRHGLSVGAHTILLTQFFMVLTFPLSYPISRVLDLLLGKEIGAVYNRERLLELIKMSEEHENLEQDEANIIAGALELRKKTVAEIMTPLTDVFMIPVDAILNFDTVSEIMRQGYSRVPIYDTTPENIIALLNIKDLALVDPDDNTPVQTLCKFYNHHVYFILDDTTLDVMLETFRQGKTHLAFVQHIINANDDRDPEYRTVGIVTLEDVIEEIIQAEIMDESDVVSSTRRRNKRTEAAAIAALGAGGGDSSALALTTAMNVTPFKSDYAASLITPQLRIASFQFLSTTLEPFKCELITPTILHRLTNHPDVAVAYRMRTDLEEHDLNSIPLLYQSGKPCDYFIIILEGRVEVKCGKEGITFQGGPFSYFGISALVLGPQEEELLANTARAIVESTAAVTKNEKEKAAKNEDEKLRRTENQDFTTKTTANGGTNLGTPPSAETSSMVVTKSALKPPRTRKSSKGADGESENLLPNDAKPTKRSVHIAGDNDESETEIARRTDTGGASKPVYMTAMSMPANVSAAAAAAVAGPRKDSNAAVFDVPYSAASLLPSFIPDYDVRPVSDLLYMRIMRAHYLAAFRASQYERRSHDRTKSVRSAVEYLRAEFDNFTKPQSPSHNNTHGPSLASVLMQRGMYSAAGGPSPPPTAASGLSHHQPPVQAEAIAENEPNVAGSSLSSSRPTSQMAAHDAAVVGTPGVPFSLGSIQNSVYSSQASNLHANPVAVAKPPRTRTASNDAAQEIEEHYMSTTSLNHQQQQHAATNLPAVRRPHPAVARSDSSSIPSSSPQNTPYATPTHAVVNRPHFSGGGGGEVSAAFNSSGDGIALHPLSRPISTERLSVKGARAHEKVAKQGQLNEWGTVNEMKPTKVIIGPQAPDDSDAEHDASSTTKKFSMLLKTNGSSTSTAGAAKQKKTSALSRSVSHAQSSAAAAHSSSSSPSSTSTAAGKRTKRNVTVVLGTDSDPERELRDVK